MSSTQATCVMCGSALTMQQARDGILCNSVACAWKHRALPAHLRCEVCDRPLTTHEIARRTCSRHACLIVGMVERPMARRRERYEATIADVAQWRDEVAAREGIADPATYVVRPIPFQRGVATPLDEWRIAKHREHLQRAAGGAIEQRQRGEIPVEPLSVRPELPPQTPAMSAVLIAACAACRGTCCLTGAEHAYLTVYTMHRYLERHPEATKEQIVEDYLTWLPTESISTGCVYQHEQGCVLPREMRSRTCGEFYCSPLTELQQQRTEGQPLRAFFTPDDDNVFREGVFASERLVQIVRRYGGDDPSSTTVSLNELADGGEVSHRDAAVDGSLDGGPFHG